MVSNQAKILCLFSAPLIDDTGNPLDTLDMTSEREAILNELSANNRVITIRIGFATTQTLARGIRDGFNILHFSGHGSKQCLAFEDGRGGCHPINGKYLTKLIGLGGPFDVAMISSCYSEPIAKMILKAGVRHVVGIKRNSPILDYAATKFATTFYGNLLSNDSIQRSFDLAKLIVETDPFLAKQGSQEVQNSGKYIKAEHQKFILLPNNIPSFHQKTVFKVAPHGKLIVEEILKAPTNVPVKPKSFRGRSQEIHQAINELFDNRLVTLTGTGGIGKTTIAREVARWFHIRGYFNDGIFNLELGETTDASRIIDLLGTCTEQQFSNIKEMIRYLQDRNILLILDNAEQILNTDDKKVKEIINEILMHTERTKILVTSRRPIGSLLYEEEHLCRILGMSLIDSEQLFLTTSRRPIGLKESKSADFKEILVRLGGHSLSIVIMAKQLKNGITIGDLLRRIDEGKSAAIKACFPLNEEDNGDRHLESLNACLMSSLQNLTPTTKELFMSLSMLPAGITENNFKNLFKIIGWENAEHLNNASLAEIDSHNRIMLLPPVRLFAEGLLTEEVKQKYAQEIVELMVSCSQQIYNDIATANSLRAIYNFTLEEPNLMRAIKLPYKFNKTSDNTCSGIAILCRNMVEFYCFTDKNESAKKVEEIAIPILEKLYDTLGIGLVLSSVGVLEHKIGNNQSAEQKLVKAINIFEEEGRRILQASTLLYLGSVYMQLGNSSKAEEKFFASMKIYEEENVREGKGYAFLKLGILYKVKGNYSEAKEKFENALAIFENSNENGQANILFHLGELMLVMDKTEIAEMYLKKALVISKNISNEGAEANILAVLSKIYETRNEHERAEVTIKKALLIFRKLGIRVGEANSLFIFAHICISNNRLDEGVKALVQSLEIYQEIKDFAGIEKIMELLNIKNS